MLLTLALVLPELDGAPRRLGLGLIMDGTVELAELAARPLDHPLDAVQPHLQHVQLGPVADAHKVVAGAVEEISPLGRVEVEEDARHHDGALLQQGVEERQAVGDVDQAVLGQRRLQRRQVQPDVEGAVGRLLVARRESDLAQPLQHVVALHLEVALQRLHLRLDLGGVQHRHRRLLERDVGAAVQVAAAGAERRDEFLGPHDPGHPPAGQAKPLRQSVDQDHVVLVDVLDVGSRRDGAAVAVGTVVVARVELVKDQCRAVSANVLDQGQLFGMQCVARRVARIRRQDD